MKKQKLLTLAMIGMSAGLLLTGCEKDARRDNRDNRQGGNTAAAEHTSPVAINQSCNSPSGCPARSQGQPSYDQSQGYYIQQNPQAPYYQGQQQYQPQPSQGYIQNNAPVQHQ